MLLFLKLYLIISGKAGTQPLPASKEGRESKGGRREGEWEEKRKGRSKARRVGKREEERRETGKKLLPAGHEQPITECGIK